MEVSTEFHLKIEDTIHFFRAKDGKIQAMIYEE
jgi:hypothetical protein